MSEGVGVGWITYSYFRCQAMQGFWSNLKQGDWKAKNMGSGDRWMSFYTVYCHLVKAKLCNSVTSLHHYIVNRVKYHKSDLHSFTIVSISYKMTFTFVHISFVLSNIIYHLYPCWYISFYCCALFITFTLVDIWLVYCHIRFIFFTLADIYVFHIIYR